MSNSYSNLNKPVEVGNEYEAEIVDISRRGDGIAKIQGLIIFVPNTKQGENAKFKVTRVENRFAIGELL
jgi:predicted RNA-binding protein with TRAM domain